MSHGAGLLKMWQRGTCKLTESLSEEARGGEQDAKNYKDAKVGNSEVENSKAAMWQCLEEGHQNKVTKKPHCIQEAQKAF